MTDTKNQTTNTTVKKAGRGGARPGAGRPKMKDFAGRPTGTAKKKHSIYCDYGELVNVRLLLKCMRDRENGNLDKYTESQQKVIWDILHLLVELQDPNNQK